MKFADLHLHTIFSDGTYTPLELAEESRRVGLSAIAVADHDTVSGIAPAIEAAEGLGIEVLPAIELSAEYEGAEVHILGYLIDYHNAELLEKLSFLKENRIQRIYKIIDKLKLIGINLRPEAVFELAQLGTVGRLHVARAMIKEGLAGSFTEIFQKYIGDKCPAYELGFKFSPEQAISLIKQTGGIPVLAHPYTIKDDDLLETIVSRGIMGIEVYYPEHSQSMRNFYLDFAQRRNLLVTGGSDCHGDAKSQIKIGSMKIPYALVEKLKSAKAQR
ncbi:MAG: PHP domain-containing protein [Candidatus Omnitrophota bacterium]|nr:PHP domain-containing protein [Candidatus Omnitrophota bacterium]